MRGLLNDFLPEIAGNAPCITPTTSLPSPIDKLGSDAGPVFTSSQPVAPGGSVQLLHSLGALLPARLALPCVRAKRGRCETYIFRLD